MPVGHGEHRAWWHYRCALGLPRSHGVDGKPFAQADGCLEVVVLLSSMLRTHVRPEHLARYRPLKRPSIHAVLITLARLSAFVLRIDSGRTHFRLWQFVTTPPFLLPISAGGVLAFQNIPTGMAPLIRVVTRSVNFDAPGGGPQGRANRSGIQTSASTLPPHAQPVVKHERRS